ncbi:hypothetical protein BDDG_02661 [Blastomyces dermatitidis ATCC 18188]|uniref:Rhodopsin domain-containing protein n=1 Tax=Ajellomyces dermatitidis (strain ATCC 18188 / CBS 674.68) TaxID=653446 RepID=F2T907_AJEDA|nr:hypothetical protein BDDG_02661 [Blastomyces dermatitidis ATCC 18188]
MSDSEAAAATAVAATVREFNVELWTQYGFGVLITALRSYARVNTVGFTDLRVDDYLIWFAIVRRSLGRLLGAIYPSLRTKPSSPLPLLTQTLKLLHLLYSAQFTLAFFAVNHGQGLANNGMTDAARAALDPDSEEYRLRVFGSKIQVIGWTCYSFLICMLKMSMLVFYTRLMEGLSRYFSIRIWFGIGLVATTFLASVITIYAACRPVSKYWQINPDPGNRCQGAVSRPIVFVTYIASVLTDIYLIMIPLPMLWGTRLKLAKKIGATIVLGAGVFVLVCATLKTIFVEVDPIHGAELAGRWGTREAFVSVVTTNLPMMLPLVRMWLKPLLGSAIFSSRMPYKHPTGFRTIGGGDGYNKNNSHKSSSNKRRGQKASSNNQHATSGTIPLTESEEQIFQDVKLQNLRVSA